ncbi:putative WRKY transcription factor 53 [Apostasia shenzhenica]|uniref:Putative WRKY transcription factor 53 n=1 Tax=Apostasia shenzhenica TaxID=1088818 RepID=A0A2I0ATT9_9ASPA|nr:putative WRKY transcription factor 53 [Apostasia shenzhenica]
MPRWNGQVRVSSGASVEAPTDDGHSWRKYGQKDILGSKFPRCTHRHTHGCLATKQVQRSDEDPSIFDISYRGAHTCSQDHRLPTAGPPPEDRTLQRISPPIPTSDRQQPQPLSSQILRTSLKVEIEGLSSDDHQLGSSPSFSFPSTPESCTNKPENHLLWNYSQAFLTAASPETRFFSPPSPLVVNNSGAGEARLQSSEVSGILSAAAPATSSQPFAVVFQPEQLEFDAEFPFDFSS